MRSAIRDKIQEDRRELRQISREMAMDMIGQAGCEDVFESLQGEDFERR